MRRNARLGALGDAVKKLESKQSMRIQKLELKMERDPRRWMRRRWMRRR